MSKKALVIVGLAAAIAATSGIAYASNSNSLQKTKTFSDPDTVIVSDYDANTDNDDPVGSHDDSGIFSPQTDSTEKITSQTEPSVNSVGEDDPDNGGQALQANTVASFSVQRVVQRSDGEEQPTSLIFGKFADACYLTLYDDGTAELCLNPSAGTVKKGEFTVKDDFMYLDYGSVEPAVYRVLYAESGGIDSVIVPYGEYDVYFG